MRTTLANSGERIYLAILPRVCGHRCLRSRSCACPSNQSRASARCSLDPRIRSASHIYVAVDSWRGPGRPARRVQAGLGEEREPACHLRPPRVCPHLAHPSMYGTTCPYLPFGCQSSRQCVVSMRRTSRPFLMYTAPPARRGRRIHAVRELWQGNRPARTKMPLCWQDVANMRSRALDDGKMLARCVPQRPTVTGLRPNALLAWLAVAIYSRGAFSGALPRQDSAAVRSRVPCRGKISPRCVPGRLPMAKCSRNALPGGNPWQVLRSMHPKSGFGRENRQFVAAYCRRVFKMSWLWQDMRAMHPKSPANRLSGTHGVKILPGKGSFRCTGPSNHARRANLAIL